MALLLEAMRRLREDWALRPRHPYLSPADCVPTIVEGGEWLVSYPAACDSTATSNTCPSRRTSTAGAPGSSASSRTGSSARPQPTRGSRAHPPRDRLAPRRCPAGRGRIDASDRRSRPRRRPCRRPARAIGGLDNWHDGATLTVEAGIPAICLGPATPPRPHDDERVPISDLIACAQALAVTAMRFCGSPSRCGAEAAGLIAPPGTPAGLRAVHDRPRIAPSSGRYYD